MNRIYQGRILSVEPVADRKAAKGQECQKSNEALPVDWEEILWRHHALFQDAVNYYLVALLAMAETEGNPLHKIRCQISGDTECQVWEKFRRRGTERPGLSSSVGKYLVPGKKKPSIEECFKAVLSGNQSPPELLDLALRELLEVCKGDGAIRNESKSMFPRFCIPNYPGQYASQKAAKDDAQKEIARFLYSPVSAKDLSKIGKQLKFEAFANPMEGAAPKQGDAARKILLEALTFLEGKSADVKKSQARLAKAIKMLPDSVTIPAYSGGSVKFALKHRFYAYLLFAHVEQSTTTFGALRDAFPAPKEEKTASGKRQTTREDKVDLLAFGDDPVKLSRVDRGYVFRAFTSLGCWNEKPDDSKPAWKWFDFAAFAEALKAIHQIDLKEAERAKERAEIERRLDYMRGDLDEWTGGESEEEAPPRVSGDPRIDRIEKILNTDLAAEYEMVEGETLPYGLQERTIRGFRDIRKAWRKFVGPGEVFSEAKRARLMEALREYQTENAERVGSVALFEQLTLKPNWLVWQEPAEQTWEQWKQEGYAEDPLSALLRVKEDEERVKRLKEPVRLTPADPVHSPRQYLFSDWSAGCKHDPGVQSVTVACAVINPETGLNECRMMRLRYSAPRLLRDGLKTPGDAPSHNANWMQPMMEALLPDTEISVDFSKAAVALMPVMSLTGQKRFLLNFPVSLDTAPLVEKLGLHPFSNADFLGYRNTRTHLRWFAEKGKTPPGWPARKSLSILAADLGQRDAAATAIAEMSRGDSAPNARAIGEINHVKWHAALKQVGLHRLPGEDAHVWRDGVRQVELSGERGRNATELERDEAISLCAMLGQDEGIFGEEVSRLSFPKLNDKLLVALRRAQSRLARFHSWAWMIACDQPKRRDKAFAEMEKDEQLSDAWRDWARQRDITRLKGAMIVEIERLRPLLKDALEHIANRILPRRDAVWVWRARADAAEGHVLATERRAERDGTILIRGQRGLSLERVEQLEELRKRCQSLNRALMHTPGEKPVMGRGGRGIELPDPCPEILGKLEAVREQRVNQTAHMIVAEALGVRLRRHEITEDDRTVRDIHGEYEQIPGRRPVDLVVLEDLSRYLSSQDRPKRENSRLMKWCHRAVLAKVKELCEPYGIPVLETPAAWSSRFSSRDGRPGFRAVELTPQSRKEFPWRLDLKKHSDVIAGTRKVEPAERARLEMVCSLFDILDKLNDGRADAGKKPRTLIAPLSGGPLFVPLGGGVMQADINAAVNLALRAVASPKTHDVHSRIRTERGADKVLNVRRGNTLERHRWDEEHQVVPQGRQTDGDDLGRNPNYFSDPFRLAEFGRAEINGIPAASGKELWGTVKKRAWLEANRINNDRLEKWGYGRILEEDIPF